MSEKQLAVLKANAFKPGQSGNPEGRPKKENVLSDCIDDALYTISNDGTLTKAQRMALALVNKAMLGDLRAIELVLEYKHVKPKIDFGVTGKLSFSQLVKEIEKEAEISGSLHDSSEQISPPRIANDEK